MAVMPHILGTQHADWKREHGNKDIKQAAFTNTISKTINSVKFPMIISKISAYFIRTMMSRTLKS